MSRISHYQLEQFNFIYNQVLDTGGIILQFSFMFYYFLYKEIELIYFVLWLANICASILNHLVILRENEVAEELVKITKIEQEKKKILNVVKKYLLKRVNVCK